MADISVVAPSCKQARSVSICRDSIWFQDYCKIEISVVMTDLSLEQRKFFYNTRQPETRNTHFTRQPLTQ